LILDRTSSPTAALSSWLSSWLKASSQDTVGPSAISTVASGWGAVAAMTRSAGAASTWVEPVCRYPRVEQGVERGVPFGGGHLDTHRQPAIRVERFDGSEDGPELLARLAGR
jgi:hypothetical protein